MKTPKFKFRKQKTKNNDQTYPRILASADLKQIWVLSWKLLISVSIWVAAITFEWSQFCLLLRFNWVLVVRY